MKAVVFGYHDMGWCGLKALLEHGFEVAALFTHPDDPAENTARRSCAELAAEHGIKVFAPADINHPLWVEHIRRLAPDIIFSFYYRRLLGTEILAIPSRGAVNLHGSMLPRYRGRAPLNWVLVNGERETGVTLHYMTERADAGDIIGQRRIAIDHDDNAATLSARLVEEAGLLLDELLPALRAGSAPRTPQDERQASYFGGRTPADGELSFARSARECHNFVRAVTRPWPGAFTFAGERRLVIWESQVVDRRGEPGAVLGVDPLTIACGDGAIAVRFGQIDGGVYMGGGQLAAELALVPGVRLGRVQPPQPRQRVLILGVNGFIGNHLTERLLASGDYEVYGMDISSHAIERLLEHPDFHFVEGDIGIHSEWLEYHVKKCDIVLPLVAIATPIEYVRNPLRVFELDFEENLKIVRYCVKYGKRIVFPSTSEVYGMCDEPFFDEDSSKLVTGPINKQRWIYATSKQLLDRVIWAYGAEEGLRFTLFRPFNWIGPRLDSLDSARIGSSRAITQLILNLVEGSPINLIDGGHQKRCFTDVSEGIEALFRIIANRGGRCDGQIINIGNPDNEASIEELAGILLDQFEAHPLREAFPPFAGFREVESSSYYGDGYQDVQHRRPSIRNANRLLDWQPRIGLADSVAGTLDYFLTTALEDGER